MELIEKKELTPFNVLGDTSNIVKEEIGEETPKKEKKEELKSSKQQEQEKKPEKKEEAPSSKEQGKPENNVEVDLDLPKYVADIFKRKKLLPEDFEITDDLTVEEIEDRIAEYNKEPLKNAVRKELEEELEKKGITVQDRLEKEYSYYGVTPAELNKVKALKYLGSYKFEEDTDKFKEEAELFLKQYYTLKKLNDKQIERNVKGDLEDESLSDIIKNYQEELLIDGEVIEKDINSKVEAAKNKELEKKKKDKEKTQELLSQMEKDGVYSKEDIAFVKKALFKQTEVVKIDGKPYKTTLYNKKLMELNTPEKELEFKINFLLGTSIKDIEKRVENKVNENTLTNLAKYARIKSRKDVDKKAPTPDKRGIMRKAIN